MRVLRLIVFCAAIALPVAAQEVSDRTVTDASIAAEIRSLLIELDGYEDITFTVRGGIVTLAGETVEPAAIPRLEALVTDISGVRVLQNEIRETTDLAKRLDPAIERIAARVRQGIAFLPLALVALAAGIFVFLVGLLIARRRQPWDRMAPNAFIADIYRQIVRLAFTVLGVVLALDILGATALLGTILGAAGIIGLAIGFAVRDTVENFIASIMLSIRQPFRPNDVVEICGDTGKVIRLTSRATILLSFDGNHIRIPNATVFKSRIVNFSRNQEIRFLFDVGVEAAADIGRARDIAETTVEALPFVCQTPAAATWIQDITDSGVILRVTGWIDQRETGLLAARGEALRQVMLALASAGIAIPDTTYRIRLDEHGAATRPAPAEETPAQTAPSTAARAPSRRVAPTEPESEKDLDEIVRAERRAHDHDDLLNRDAPEE